MKISFDIFKLRYLTFIAIVQLLPFLNCSQTPEDNIPINVRSIFVLSRVCGYLILTPNNRCRKLSNKNFIYHQFLFIHEHSIFFKFCFT